MRILKISEIEEKKKGQTTRDVLGIFLLFLFLYIFYLFIYYFYSIYLLLINL